MSANQVVNIAEETGYLVIFECFESELPVKSFGYNIHDYLREIEFDFREMISLIILEESDYISMIFKIDPNVVRTKLSDVSKCIKARFKFGKVCYRQISLGKYPQDNEMITSGQYK